MLKVLAKVEIIMCFFNALLKLLRLSQDFIFSFKLFHTLTQIFDKQFCLLVVRAYFPFKILFVWFYAYFQKSSW